MEVRQPTEREFEDILTAAGRMKLDLTQAMPRQFYAAYSQCGLAGFVRVIEKDDFRELATLGTVKEYRNQGVSSLMVRHLQSLFEELHLLTVIPEYFQKLGFESITSIPEPLQQKYNTCELWHGYGKPVVMKWSKH